MMLDVTIIVSPRERFGTIIDCLKSIFNTVDDSIPVIAFIPQSPEYVTQALIALKEQREFDLRLFDYPIHPNEARNQGFEIAETEFVAFIDNDIICERDWLDNLLKRAIDDNADLVAPTICMAPPLAFKAHHAGGKLHIEQKLNGDYIATEQHQCVGQLIENLDSLIPNADNEVCEFHCFLARSAFIKKVYPFDERMVSRDQMDMALRAMYFGAKVRYERTAIVSYLGLTDYIVSDLPYLSYRWSDYHVHQSIEAFTQTWGVKVDSNRILNQWVRPQRLKFYASCFKNDFEELGETVFRQVHMDTCEPIFVRDAALAREHLPPPRKPKSLDPVRVKQLLTGLAAKSLAVRINALPNDVHNNDQPKVIAGMATMPSRLATLETALKSILPQVDELVLFLDHFEFPFEITHPKIKVVHARDSGDLKANGKFYGLIDAPDNVFYASIDDDIKYPDDYIQTMISHYNGLPIGVHGSVFNYQNELKSYLDDRSVINRTHSLGICQRADILGTCTALFNTADLRFDVSKWGDTNMVDLMFAIETKRAGLSLELIPRKGGWIEQTASEQADSIYTALRKNDHRQTELAKSLIAMPNT